MSSVFKASSILDNDSIWEQRRRYLETFSRNIEFKTNDEFQRFIENVAPYIEIYKLFGEYSINRSWYYWSLSFLPIKSYNDLKMIGKRRAESDKMGFKNFITNSISIYIMKISEEKLQLINDINQICKNVSHEINREIYDW